MNQVSLLIGSQLCDFRYGSATLNSPKPNEGGEIATMERVAGNDGFRRSRQVSRPFLVVQTVNSLSAMRETWVPSLGQEDPLEKEIATHSSILAWKIPWVEEFLRQVT